MNTVVIAQVAGRGRLGGRLGSNFAHAFRPKNPRLEMMESPTGFRDSGVTGIFETEEERIARNRRAGV